MGEPASSTKPKSIKQAFVYAFGAALFVIMGVFASAIYLAEAKVRDRDLAERSPAVAELFAVKLGKESNLMRAVGRAMMGNAGIEQAFRLRNRQALESQGRELFDTLRADHMSCYGYGRKTTPCVDLFAKEATLFKNAIAAAPWTSASIGSMITGQYPAAIGIELFGSSLKESVRGMMGPRFVTLAELFRERNYTTRGIVSNVHIGSRMGFQQGYEAYEESDARAADYISSPSVTAKAIRFLKEHGGEKFFLFVHYFDPHYDYILHENYNYFPEYRGRFFSDQQHVDLLKRIPEVLPDDLRYITALYDSEISFTDEYIGRLLDTVRKLGLYDDLLIVFVADHGEEFLERGTIGHGGTLYQEQVHVPLIVKLPGQKEGRVIDEYVGLIDMMTSTAAWAGVAMPRGYEHDGEPIDAGNPASLRGREIVSETTHVDHPAESVTREGWKLVFDRKTSAQMLFDLAGDPGELANRTGDSEPERERLHSILRSWDEQIEPKRPKGKQRQPKFSEEQLKDLKSLGYIQ